MSATPLKPMSVKAAVMASFETKVRCTSVVREPAQVRIMEQAVSGEAAALHDCMRDVQSAVLTFVGSPESHPQVELRVAVLGNVGLEVGSVYKLTLEKL